MSIFERYLTIWVFLCIIVGVALGQLIPAPFLWLGTLEIAKVNIPVGLLIWVMIIPMLLRIDFMALHKVCQYWRGIGHAVHQLSGQTFFHGAAWLVIHPAIVRTVSASRATRQLYCRP